MAVTMPLSLYTWLALINNFAHDRAGFDGADMGVLHSVREIPGFLAFTLVYVLLLVREQRLALIALALLGLGTMMTGALPSYLGLIFTCFLASVGFHFHEVVVQSLTLQWLSKEEAPRRLGQLMAVGSFGSLAAFAMSWLLLELLDVSMEWVLALGGATTLAAALLCWRLFPLFQGEVAQHRHLVLRKRYWLFYLITFMAGARRQIFVVFAGFMLVEKFGVEVASIALIFLVNNTAQMITAPLIGRMIGRLGERHSLMLEYAGLVAVFIAYAVVDSLWLAVVLYLLDHQFFALAIARKTYFQKIADPADIAPTAGVAFSINHIAAVIIPVVFGLIWLVSPAAVFLAGAAMAGVSFLLSMLIPRDPRPGNEVAVAGWSSGASPAVSTVPTDG